MSEERISQFDYISIKIILSEKCKEKNEEKATVSETCETISNLPIYA